jgi:hypothetical protein
MADAVVWLHDILNIHRRTLSESAFTRKRKRPVKQFGKQFKKQQEQ